MIFDLLLYCNLLPNRPLLIKTFLLFLLLQAACTVPTSPRLGSARLPTHLFGRSPLCYLKRPNHGGYQDGGYERERA